MKTVVFLAMGIFLSFMAQSQVSINGSYLNITRPAGGPVAVNDVLEIHAVIAVNSGTTISPLSFTATIPTGTTYIPGTLAVRTNENSIGVTNTGNYTDAASDDRGTVSGTSITVYMGDGAGATAGGSVTGGTTKPRFYNVTSIMMVAYQIKVTSGWGTTIATNGTFHYKNGSTVFHTAITGTSLLVSAPITCGNATATNYLTDETNGTFSSGTAQTRSFSTNVSGYSNATLGANNPSDGEYSIVNNSSATDYSGSSPAGGDKVFAVWDVIGDHTGASTAAGNSPATGGNTGGYLLAVNGTYVPATVFHTVVNGLIANNSYVVTFWIRNICPTCGCDPSTGNQNSTPGVKPNLTVSLNGNSFYSSGDVVYSGQWEQKAYVFANMPTTTATIDITNNAPGGGGNDWVMDDIAVNQCLVVLPVGLESFTGRSIPGGSLLKWRTQFSADIQYFGVERSTDGSHFSGIGQVVSNPDSSNYSFTDDGIPAEGGTFYYRLNIPDLNGKTTYSNVVRLISGNATGSLTTFLSPNPTHGSSILSIQSADAGTAMITLWNSAGALIWSTEAALASGANTAEIRLPGNLPRGIYLVKTAMGEGSAVVRLVKE
jgi:hypothetical protein